jgi:hypothetical protein
MNQPPPESPAEMAWCPECNKFTPHHLLVHDILDHAPLLGGREATSHRNWRTAPLKLRAA